MVRYNETITTPAPHFIGYYAKEGKRMDRETVEISELVELLNRCPHMWEDIKSVLKKEKPVTCLQQNEVQP